MQMTFLSLFRGSPGEIATRGAAGRGAFCHVVFWVESNQPALE